MPSVVDDKGNSNLAEFKENFDIFAESLDLKEILETFKRLCSLANAKPSQFPKFTDDLRNFIKGKEHIGLQKVNRTLNHLIEAAKKKNYYEDKRYSSPALPQQPEDLEYEYHLHYRPGQCKERKVLVVGGGPSGLRMAIEAQFLGAKVVVAEMRSNFTRINIAYLREEVISDMKELGVKNFYPRFCYGESNVACINVLQFVLLKIALLLGVEFHYEVEYQHYIPPASDAGWKAKFSTNSDLNNYEFDVLVIASGNKKRPKEGKTGTKQMIALAVNLRYNGENYEQIPGVEDRTRGTNRPPCLQKLYDKGILVNNLTYYRTEYHYCIVTVPMSTLIQHNLLKEEYLTKGPSTKDSFKDENLEVFMIKVINLVTNNSMDNEDAKQPPELNKLIPNAKGAKVQVVIYEASEALPNSSRIIEKNGKRLFISKIGDVLITPFWPFGNGIFNGFMNALDTCYIMTLWSTYEKKINPLKLLYKKEEVYLFLKSNMIKKKDFRSKLDPWCRYDRRTPVKNYPSVKSLYETDIDFESDVMEAPTFTPVKYPRLEKGKELILDKFCDTLALVNCTVVQGKELLQNGIALLIIDQLLTEHGNDTPTITFSDDPVKDNQRATNIFALKYGIHPALTADEMANLSEENTEIMNRYLYTITQFIESNYMNLTCEKICRKIKYFLQAHEQNRKVLQEAEEVQIGWTDLKIEETDIIENGTPDRKDSFIKRKESGDALAAVEKNWENASTNLESMSVEKPDLPIPPEYVWHYKLIQRSGSLPNIKVSMTTGESCNICHKMIFSVARLVTADRKPVHKQCLRCAACSRSLLGVLHTYDAKEKRFYCKDHSLNNDYVFLWQKDGSYTEFPRSWIADRTQHSLRMDDLLNNERQLLEPEFQASCLQWLQENPVALEEILNDLEVRWAIVRAVWKRSPLKEAVCKAVGFLEEGDIERRDMIGTAIEMDAKFDEEEGELKTISFRSAVSLAMQELSLAKKMSAISVRRADSYPHLRKMKVQEFCHYCKKRVFMTERMIVFKRAFHRYCLKCQKCRVTLNLKHFAYDEDSDYFTCVHHKRKDVLGKSEPWRRSEATAEIDVKNKFRKPPAAATNRWKLAQMKRKISQIFLLRNQDEKVEEMVHESEA